MPAPVSFDVSLAPFPVTFNGTMPQWAQALVQRLRVTPRAPWSSFLNGGSIPTSDFGPVLYQGREWRTWNSATGAYDYHRQNGAGLVDATVSLSKLSNGTPGSVPIYNAFGRPIEVTPGSGTSGQVFTLIGGTTPGWADSFAPTGTYFETTLGSDQNVNTDSTAQVEFDTVRTQANVVFDTALNKVPVVAGQVWLFYAMLQLEDIGAPTAPSTGSIGALTFSVAPTKAECEALRNATESLLAAYNNALEASLYIRVDGAATGPSSLLNFNFNSGATRQGIAAIGIVPVATNGFVDVAIDLSETTPASPGVKLAANLNSRFGGVRII